MFVNNTLYADILLPLPLPGTFTYAIPPEFVEETEIGKRVVVQFGNTKLYTGLIKNIYKENLKDYVCKPILSVLDAFAVVNSKQFELWEWMANYYMCTQGEIMNAALPAALKLASETNILLNPSFDGNYELLNDKEFLITQAVEKQKRISIKDVSKIIGNQKVISLIKNLIEKGVVLPEEELKEKYRPRKVAYVKLNNKYENNELLDETLTRLEKKAEKQWLILISYLNLSKKFSANEKEVKRSELVESISAKASNLLALQKKEILDVYYKIESRIFSEQTEENPDDIVFSDFQIEALNELKASFHTNNVTLLHGVTSSGKTEIYINIINEVISQGKEVLYLLPEIALTTQAINRLRKYFGNSIGVYHSKYGDNEKVEVWNGLIQGFTTDEKDKKLKIIMGARSAVFLPFTNLGLIIVDEEHDTSYKQNDPAPRYNGRDTAIVLANMHKAKVILGSATPSVETYYNTQTGKTGLVNVAQRYGGVELPEILVVDLKEETYKRRMKSIFSQQLLDNISKALSNKEQIILFQNRRGFSLRVECKVCNWIPQCVKCDVSLTYHKKDNKLKCHYCGYTVKVPERCPACGSPGILMKGFGTEKAEEELALFFPDAKIARMDIDTAGTRASMQRIIADFEDNKLDVLIGTQMVTKGLDFNNVSVVGILNAGNLLNYPDFRSHERSYQLMAQVAGRAGRKNKRGVVIIQAWDTKHSVIRNVVDNNYLALFKSQIYERKKFKYPPFVRLIKISVKYRDENFLNKAAADLAQRLRRVFGDRILGPEFPVVSRINNLFIKNIMCKFERTTALNSLKDALKNEVEKYSNVDEYKKIKVIIDVDPL